MVRTLSQRTRKDGAPGRLGQKRGLSSDAVVPEITRTFQALPPTLVQIFESAVVIEFSLMVAKRHWGSWPARFVSELNGTSGLAGAGGALLAGLSFGGLTAASGVAAVVTGGFGILLMGGAVIAADRKSVV